MSIFEPQVGPPAQELGSIPAPPPLGSLDDDQAPEDLADVVPQVDEPLVRSVLVGLGQMAHVIDPITPELWRFTDDELDQATPPLTRLANRNDTLRRALLHGDYVVLALTFSTYLGRNVQIRRHATDGQLRQARSADLINGARVDGGGPEGNGSFTSNGSARWSASPAQGLDQ